MCKTLMYSHLSLPRPTPLSPAPGDVPFQIGEIQAQLNLLSSCSRRDYGLLDLTTGEGGQEPSGCRDSATSTLPSPASCADMQCCICQTVSRGQLN